MNKTQRIREHLRGLDPQPERLSKAAVEEIAGLCGASVEYTGHVVRGYGIPIGDGEFPYWRKP